MEASNKVVTLRKREKERERCHQEHFFEIQELNQSVCVCLWVREIAFESNVIQLTHGIIFGLGKLFANAFFRQYLWLWLWLGWMVRYTE